MARKPVYYTGTDIEAGYEEDGYFYNKDGFKKGELRDGKYYDQYGEVLDFTYEKPPTPQKSKGRKAALKNYTDWVRWKREELQNLIGKYRTEYPLQIQAYQNAAYGALPEAKKQMWSGMYTNLDQRGLADSSSFRAGARTDLEKWLSGEKAKIADTAQGMETTAQNTILTSLGRPNYAQLYQNWVLADDQQAAYNFREWEKSQ